MKFTKWNRLFISFLVFILVFSIFVFTASIEYDKSYKNQVKYAEDELFKVKLNIENLITSRMVAVNGLKAHIEINPDFSQEDFNYFAKGIYESSNDVVQSMSFLTNTTISHIYPYEIYSHIVGTDLALNPEQSVWINYAKNNLRSIITAPVNLVEGGLGIIVRIPVDLEGIYFGQVSIVFDYENVVYASGLKNMSKDYFIKLKKFDELNQSENIIWANFEDMDIEKLGNIVANQVNLYGTEMNLIAFPKEGFDGKSSLFYLILIIGFTISSVSSIFAYKLRKNQEELYIQYNEINNQKNYIQFLADCDYLTNLYNRRKFAEDISLNIASKNKGSVLLFDIDNFKNINDTQGHHYGDMVLKHVGFVIKESLCEGSMIYRIGGDEFAIHNPGTIENEKIEKCIEMVHSTLKKNNYINNIKNNITASFGIVKYPEDSNSADDILMKADIAMYKSKHEGKNRFSYFTEELVDNFGYRVGIENELQNAVEKKQFKLLYQPIVDSKTKEIVSLEALIRINDSRMSPAEFIPVAESSGLIIPIGNWVIEEVCKNLDYWRSQSIEIKPVAINLSAKQFYTGNIVSYLKKSLQKYNLEPYLIEIEITESILIENSGYTLELLTELRDYGMKISLDDFGTGYSSLSYLTYMPVDKVKIDKSLKDKFLFLENQEVMQGIISICHGLGLKVVTEGVESKEEFEKLKIYGSDFVQGYYFERPSNFEKITEILIKKGYNNL